MAFLAPARLAVALSLVAVAAIAAKPEAAPAVQEAETWVELAREQLALGLAAGVPDVRAFASSVEIRLRVRHDLGGGCMALGNLAAASLREGSLEVELCALTLRFVANAAQAVELLSIRAQNASGGARAAAVARLSTEVKLTIALLVDQQAAVHSAVVLFDPTSAEPIPMEFTLCAGLHVAYLVSHDRPAKECLSMTAAEREEGVAWAWAQFDAQLSRADRSVAPATYPAKLQFLQWDLANLLMNITRFAVIHEVAHNAPGLKLGETITKDIPAALARELESDFAALRALGSTDANLVGRTLNYYWGALAERKRAGSPDAASTFARSLAIVVSAYCMEPKNEAESLSAQVERYISDESPLVARAIREREQRNEFCKGLAQIVNRTTALPTK